MLIPIGDDNRKRDRFPWVVVTVIAACFGAWLLQLTSNHAVTSAWGTVPWEITNQQDLSGTITMRDADGQIVQIQHHSHPGPWWLPILTGMFLHGSWLHILGNMLYLWIFGDQIEDRLGRTRFLLFYLACGVVATLSHWWLDRDSVVPLVGASGAIAGVLGAYLLACPRNRVSVLVFLFVIVTVVHVPAFLVLLGWIGLQIYGVGAPADGVAYAAHVGGFAAGLVCYPLLRLSRRETSAQQRGT